MALNSLGPDPAYWESKRGQYVTRRLSLGEWRTVLGGIFSSPAFPAADVSAGLDAYMSCYLEPYEGEGGAAALRGNTSCCFAASDAELS